MQRGGGGDETERVQPGAGEGRQLQAVGDPVGQGEQRGGGHRQRQRRAHGEGHAEAEGEYRGGDAGFHEWQLQALEAEQPADQHGADEGAGQGEARGSLLLGGPEADGEHRQQVVEAGERMGEAGDQAVFAVAGVGEGQRRSGEQGEGGEQLGQFHWRFLVVAKWRQAAVSRPWRSMKAMISSSPGRSSGC